MKPENVMLEVPEVPIGSNLQEQADVFGEYQPHWFGILEPHDLVFTGDDSVRTLLAKLKSLERSNITPYRMAETNYKITLNTDRIASTMLPWTGPNQNIQTPWAKLRFAFELVKEALLHPNEDSVISTTSGKTIERKK
jgi:hypothetical protein